MLKNLNKYFKDFKLLDPKDVEYIVVHCLLTPADKFIDVNTVDEWHLERGFTCCGYHKVYQPDGTIQIGRPISVRGAHAKGYNSKSVGVAYAGGGISSPALDTRTEEQKATMLYDLHILKKTFPNAKIIGHNEISPKTCPGFDVQEEYKHL